MSLAGFTHGQNYCCKGFGIGWSILPTAQYLKLVPTLFSAGRHICPRSSLCTAHTTRSAKRVPSNMRKVMLQRSLTIQRDAMGPPATEYQCRSSYDPQSPSRLRRDHGVPCTRSGYRSPSRWPKELGRLRLAGHFGTLLSMVRQRRCQF